MNFDKDDLINVSDASKRGVSSLINEAEGGRQRIVLRNHKPVAAVVSMESVERLSRLDELEDDLRLLSVARARTVVDDGRRHTLEDVAAEFGVDLDGEDED